MCVSFFVAGSYICRCRPDRGTGARFADGCDEPSRHTGGLSGGRTADVIQSRPRWSSIGLWTLFRLVQIGSSPQYGDGADICGEVRGVLESRTVSGIWLATWRTGSSTGT